MFIYRKSYVLSILTIPKKSLQKSTFSYQLHFHLTYRLLTHFMNEIANLHRNNMQQVDRSVVSAKDDKSNNE